MASSCFGCRCVERTRDIAAVNTKPSIIQLKALLSSRAQNASFVVYAFLQGITVSEFAEAIKSFLLSHKDWAGPILLIAAFGESLVVIGLFIPATALMIFTGGLVQQGVLDAPTVIIWSIIGAVLGDAASYWIGRGVGPSLVRRWPLNKDPTAIARARLFFRKFGFISIFIGRFLGPIRSTIPMVAGMARMRHLTFQIANVASAVAWVPIMLLPGYFVTSLIGDVSNIGWKEIVGVIVLILALTVLFSWIGVRMNQRRDGRPRRVRPPRTQPL